jgi:hypothetical protein
VDAEARLALFEQNWWKDAFSQECALGGVEEGDVRLCLGPLYYSIGGRSTFEPLQTPTAEQRLATRLFFVTSSLGPYCAAPTVIRMPVERPVLWLTVVGPEDCVNLANYTFNGTYELWQRDTQRFEFTEYVYVLKKVDAPVTMRLLLRRAGSPRDLSASLSALPGGTGKVWMSLDNLLPS